VKRLRDDYSHRTGRLFYRSEKEALHVRSCSVWCRTSRRMKRTAMWPARSVPKSLSVWSTASRSCGTEGELSENHSLPAAGI